MAARFVFMLAGSLSLALLAEEVALLDAVDAVDRRADAAVAGIASVGELAARQTAWRAAWLAGIGGLPETRCPLNACEGPAVRCDGFTLRNVLFESLPGVFVVGHLALPDAPGRKPPYPAVLMPMGHSDTGILNPRYAAHLAMMARAGFAAFSWDPLSQGERRQAVRPEHDYADNCSTEHTRLGFRGWLVGWNFARFRIWDGIRALDYLTGRADIDPRRIGVCGTSGGGTMSAYLQALDGRITAGFPNCYVSSIRAVFRERGCHDAEQFFFGQLNAGVNHAAILAMSQPRVSLAVGSRWRDYFPHAGAVETFAALTNLTARLALPSRCWHFSCDGPHGLPPPTRLAQVDWMRHCLQGDAPPKPLARYQALGGVGAADDPATAAPLPFPTTAAFFTATHHVRDLRGFKSLYVILAERAAALAKERKTRTRDERREIVRRRAGIRPLDELRRTFGAASPKAFDHPFGWWYLKGAYGCRRENEAAMLATLGKSVVGRDAERIILESARRVERNGGRPIVLKAAGPDCIAAAHAYAAEPQLVAGVDFSARPPSWTDMVTDLDPAKDSFALAVWGALEEYDWPDLVPPSAGGGSRR